MFLMRLFHTYIIQDLFIDICSTRWPLVLISHVLQLYMIYHVPARAEAPEFHPGFAEGFVRGTDNRDLKCHRIRI